MWITSWCVVLAAMAQEPPKRGSECLALVELEGVALDEI